MNIQHIGRAVRYTRHKWPCWMWECPTCHQCGFVRGTKPTFSRCFDCDSAALPYWVPPPLKITEF